jgi:hypothetical protein
LLAAAGRESKLTVFEIVFATAVPITKAGKKLKTAETITAVLGFKDLVAMTVEVAFAASWKPFEKSNIKARAIVIMVVQSM